MLMNPLSSLSGSLRAFGLGACFLLSFALHGEVTNAWLLLRHDGQETIIAVDPAEKDSLVAGGWNLDAVGGVQTEAVVGSGPLHRLARVKDRGADRMLETDVAQVAAWVAQGFTDEGVVGFVADSAGPGGVPVIQYRKGENRLWLVTPEAAAAAEKDGWVRAGIHFWLWPRPPATVEPVAPPPAAAQS